MAGEDIGSIEKEGAIAFGSISVVVVFTALGVLMEMRLRIISDSVAPSSKHTDAVPVAGSSADSVPDLNWPSDVCTATLTP